MSEILDQELYGIIKNAVGFYYCYAVDPSRVEHNEDGTKTVRFDEEGSEMDIINVVASGVYVHLTEGGYVRERSERGEEGRDEVTEEQRPGADIEG